MTIISKVARKCICCCHRVHRCVTGVKLCTVAWKRGPGSHVGMFSLCSAALLWHGQCFYFPYSLGSFTSPLFDIIPETLDYVAVEYYPIHVLNIIQKEVKILFNLTKDFAISHPYRWAMGYVSFFIFGEKLLRDMKGNLYNATCRSPVKSP